MGTSVNHRSPNSPGWRLANAVVGRPEIPIERQSRHIWGAADVEGDGMLRSRLGGEAIAFAAGLAQREESAWNAVDRFDGYLDDRRLAGPTYDIARNALTKACVDRSRAAGFAREVFAEAVDYYVSRELPSHVGGEGRVSNVRDSWRVKEQLRAAVQQSVDRVSQATPPTESSWSNFVSRVVENLVGPAHG